MAPSKHSQFSASSSARLLACPGSFKVAQDLDTGVRRSSVYSAEGTLAHAISEACIVSGKEPADFLGQTRSADGFDFTIDEDFTQAVQVYVDFVRGLRAMGFAVALENVVSPQIMWDGLKPLNIDLFGTSDCVAYNPVTGQVVIADLKFGKGIAVEVVENPQLKYYAAGSLDPALLFKLAQSAGWTGSFDQLPPPKTVQLVVVQPRAIHPLGPVRSADYTPQEIFDWACKELYDGVEKALNDNGQTFVPGKHCQFCPAAQNAMCDALQQHAYDSARLAFAGAPLENIAASDEQQIEAVVGQLTNDELATLMDRLEVVGPLFDSVRRLSQARAEAGQNLNGWKLVPKRALRRWATPDAILETLDKTLLGKDNYSVRSILSPAQVEKKIGKQRYDQHVAQHVTKQSSGVTLAPVGDPRARVAAGRTAQEAFQIGAQSAPATHSDDW